MFARISLLFVVTAGLCAGAFSLGGASSRQGDAMGIPAEHPIALALQFRQELALSGDQVARLQELRGKMAKEFAPLRERAESIQHRMQELQRSDKPDPAVGKGLQQEQEELAASLRPLLERYAQSVAEMLTPEQREKIMRLSEAHSPASEDRKFPLMFAMQAREQLGITPRQFTKLQYLQADFIRAFAPLREQMELIQMEAQEKYGKTGKQPPPEFVQRMQNIQKKVMELQAQFSERAVKDVLEPNQRAKLMELLGGEHRPG